MKEKGPLDMTPHFNATSEFKYPEKNTERRQLKEHGEFAQPIANTGYDACEGQTPHVTWSCKRMRSSADQSVLMHNLYLCYSHHAKVESESIKVQAHALSVLVADVSPI